MLILQNKKAIFENACSCGRQLQAFYRAFPCMESMAFALLVDAHTAFDLARKFKALDFARRRAWNGVDSFDAFGPQTTATPLLSRYSVRSCKQSSSVTPGAGTAKKANALSQAIVGHTDGCLIADIFPVHHVVVDFTCGNVLTAANDDFFLSTVDTHAPFFVNRA